MSGRANRSQVRSSMVKASLSAAVGVAVLAGCAAGQNAQTAQEKSVIDGVNVSSGNISLDDVSISPPANSASYDAGQDAPLELVIVNDGTTVDTLTSVTADSSMARSVTLSLDGAASPQASASAAAATDSSPSSTATDESSATAPGTASGSPSGSDAPSPSSDVSTSAAPTSTPIAIPVGTSVRVGLPGAAASIVLNNLTQPLYAAQKITLVFNFSNGETIPVTTNVHLNTGDSAAPTLAVEPSGNT